MKKLMTIAVAAIVAEIAFAQAMPTPPMPTPGSALTRKQRSPKREAQRLERIKREGGLVKKPATGKCLRFVNAQKLVAETVIEDAALNIERSLHLNFEIIPGEAGAKYRPDDQAAAVVTITEADGEPTILVAPENAWAVVNVSALAKDNPAKDVLEGRVVKEVWRAFAIAMGAANSPYQPCLLRQINNLSDLDANPMVTPSPFPFNSIQTTARSLKIGERYITTYQRACEEGWAAAPTNDAQKVIWEAVKAEKSKTPTKPMKIKYDPKVGK